MTSWLEGSPGEFAKIINGSNVAAGPVTTWTGNASPTLGDIQKISYSNSWVYIQQNPVLASYVMGPWFNANGTVFPNLPTNQNMLFRIPRVPVAAATHTASGLGEIGLYVNGVAMFNALDGFSYSTASGTDKSSMGPPGQTGDGIWQRNANYAEAATFDHGHGHQPGNGEYHYHENPTALRAQLGDNLEFTGTTNYFPYDSVTTGNHTHTNDEDVNYEEATSGFHHSPIIGWARDGYPIYGPYGYSDPNDATSSVVRMLPNYQLRSITQRRSLDDWAARLHFGDGVVLNAQGQYDLAVNQWGPNVSAQFPLGAYIEDYETASGLGHLDIYNGRTTKTPEYPNGTYAYFLTIDAFGEGTFPYSVGPQYYGNVTGGKVASISESVTACFDIATVNTPPTITNILNQTTNQNTAVGPLSFTIGDTLTATSELLVTATSSNSSIVASAGIVLGGNGANRTITITPVTNATGTVVITVTVTDCSGATASDTLSVTVGTPNQLPTITNIIDQTINEDTTASTLSFTIGDSETPAANLTVSGSSSDTTRVPNANIVFGGSGANRTVTVTPAANQFGTATITVTVTDGSGGTASDSFLLTVNSINDSPTITDIADQVVNEDVSTGTLTFTIGDVETVATSLTLSAVSTNPALVPISNIVFSGTGANREVAVSPALNQSGTTTITVTVTDGNGGTASDSFLVTVNAVNDPPTITDIVNQVTNEDVDAGPFGFTIGDVETLATNLTVSGSSSNTALVPNANILFGGTEANRTVTLMPVANQSGSTTITVTIADGNGGTVNDTFVLTVNGVNDPPSITDIADQMVDEDHATSALSFTLSDLETLAANLTFVGNSSNTALVPKANIVFGGSGANRTVTVTPVANQSGSATITVSVTDGNNSTVSDTFLLTVNAVNDPPTITDIANQLIDEDTATNLLNITIGDVETLAANLTLSATSSNTALVPDANIVLGGTDANRTMVVTPLARQTGTTTITITVSDGIDSVSDTFLLTVQKANHAPTLGTAIPDQNAMEDSLFLFVLAANTFMDVDEGDVLTLVANRSDGSQLPSWLTFVAATGQFTGVPLNANVGTVDVKVTATDRSNKSISDTFTITVANSNDAPTNIVLSANSVAENSNGAVVGALTINDPDAGDLHTVILSDNRFEVVGGQLKFQTGIAVDFETVSSITLNITARDTSNSEFTKSFTISVTDVNEIPTSIHVSNSSVRENISGEVIGTLSATDPDGQQTHTFFVVDGRFEIVNGLLKLKSNQFFDVNQGLIARVNVSATDTGTPQLTLTQTLDLNVLSNPRPWQNPIQALDTDNDPGHFIAPIDALQIINLLNDPGTLLDSFGRLPLTRPANSNQAYFDTDGDGFAAPIDALLIINYLNANPITGEGEFAQTAFATSNSTPKPSPAPLLSFLALPTTALAMPDPLTVPVIEEETGRKKANRDVPRLRSAASSSQDFEEILANIASDVTLGRTKRRTLKK